MSICCAQMEKKMLHEFPNHETLNTVSKAFIEIAFFVNLTPAEPYSLFYYA